MLEREQRKLEEIKNKVLESRLAFEAGEIEADQYRETLTNIISELNGWTDELDNNTEQLAGHGKTTFPNPDDPYFRLQAQTVPYILELHAEKDRIDELLENSLTNK